MLSPIISTIAGLGVAWQYLPGWIALGVLAYCVLGHMSAPRREDQWKESQYPDCYRKTWPSDQPSDETTVAP
jgi:hypothetical protein